MSNQDVFDLEAEDVSQVAWEAMTTEIYDDVFDSCGSSYCCVCENCDTLCL
ncbi:MAG: hypothetical protein JO345_35915 [Streptosporangiaceae bacterium]|nr:hypothetical protein [Streptosporangiaceae bacterium]